MKQSQIDELTIKVDVVTDDQIQKLERIKELLSEIKGLVESIFGERISD